jgi:HlyD family secretion protein
MNTRQEPNIAKTLGIDQSLRHGKRLKRWFVVALLVIAAVIAGVIIRRMCDQTDSTQYKTDEVRRGNLTVTVTATGNLEPTNRVDVGSELSGTVRSVEADYNDKVKVGQLLAKLDTSKLEAQNLQYKAALASTKAKVLQAQATVKEARSNLTRYKHVKDLSGGKVPSPYDLDAAEAALERAQADEANARAAVSQAQATLEANEADLAKAVIRSPINGIVLTRSVEPGQTVAASLQAPVLFTLAEDLSQMELHVDVDEADVGQVQEGQEATFTVDAYPDRTFPARIVQVRYGSQTVEGVVTYETVLKVDNSDLSLRPGMTATADITVKKVENAILVPSAALRFTPPVQEEKRSSGGLVGMLLPRPPISRSKQREYATTDKRRQRVWTLRDGQLLAIPVTIGSTDGIMTEVVAGDIQPGMELLVSLVARGR